MKNKRWKILLIILLIVISLMILLFGIWSPLSPMHKFWKKYDRLQPGMNKKQVIDIMGNPNITILIDREGEVWWYDLPMPGAEERFCPIFSVNSPSFKSPLLPAPVVVRA